MIYAVVIFGIAVFYVSSLLGRHQSRMERSELELYIVLIAWCSLLVGMSVMSGRHS